MRNAHSPAPRFVVALLTLALLLTAGPAAAAKFTLGEEAVLNVNVLFQPQMVMAKDAAPVGDAGTDFFLRRVRLLVFGNVTKQLSFFIETDQPNLGRDGNWSVPIFIQDAFASYEFRDKLWVDAGMILAPFSHHGLQGALALNTVDYHSTLLRYPTTVGRIWRDAGVQVRGFAGPLHFRAGLFNGAEGVAGTNGGPAANPDDLPRAVGTVRYHVLGKEEAFFLSGIYFAEQPIVTVGVSADYQPRAVLSEGRSRDAFALAADVFVDWPMGADQEVVFQASAYHWGQGGDNANSGTGFFAEAGYRLGVVEPVVSAEFFNAQLRGADLLALRPGVNLWFQKHTFNLKVEAAFSRTGVLPEAKTGVTGAAQLQFFY